MRSSRESTGSASGLSTARASHTLISALVWSNVRRCIPLGSVGFSYPQSVVCLLCRCWISVARRIIRPACSSRVLAQARP